MYQGLGAPITAAGVWKLKGWGTWNNEQILWPGKGTTHGGVPLCSFCMRDENSTGQRATGNPQHSRNGKTVLIWDGLLIQKSWARTGWQMKMALLCESCTGLRSFSTNPSNLALLHPCEKQNRSSARPDLGIFLAVWIIGNL